MARCAECGGSGETEDEQGGPVICDLCDGSGEVESDVEDEDQ